MAFSPQFVDTWLSRSGVSPLSIAFTIEPLKKTLPFMHKRSPKSYKHFAVIFPLSHRWTNLEMTILPGAPLSPLGKLPTDALPSLEVVNLVHPKGLYCVHGESPLDHIFQSSSRLQLFSSSGIQDTRLSNLPMSELYVFCSDTLWGVDQCLELLKRLPKLKLGTFCVAQWANEAPLPLDAVVSKDLEVLSLSLLASAPGVFTHLTLPALTSLTINFGHIDAWSHATFLTFSSAFSDKLLALRLEHPPISEDDLIEYLRLLPFLSRLILKDRLEAPFIGDRLLTSLTYGGHDTNRCSPCLCPELAKLELLGVHACSDGLLAHMVESRWRGGTPNDPNIDMIPTSSLRRLESFQLGLMRKRPAPLTSRLDALRDEGLLLVYQDPPSTDLVN